MQPKKINSLEQLSNKWLMLLLVLVIQGVNVNAQNLKEGAIIIKLKSGYKKSEILKEVNINGESVTEFIHPLAKKIFGKYKVTKFERTYPGIERYDHPNSKILEEYYTIEGNFRRDRVMYDIIKEGSELFEDVEPVGIKKPLYTPNDYSLDPFHHNHLDLVNAEEAWNITKGSRSIKVAVTDPHGFYFAHPDYINTDGSNQIVYRSPLATDHTFLQNDPSHGLSVASAVAISTDNNQGISGLGFNTGLMAFPADENQMLSASYDHDAAIVEVSWIGSCTYEPSIQLIMDMIHDNGTIIVCAAGNGNIGNSCFSPDGEGNGLVYPASYNHVISVAGVDTRTPDKYTVNRPGNTPVHFTFNEGVDVSAPGWAVGVATITRDANGNFTGYGYKAGNGTSFAAPMVAGLAALILSIQTDLSPEVVENIIKSTAVNVDGLPGNEVYAGKAGTGRIDAFEAVKLTNDCFGCTTTAVVPIFLEFPNPHWSFPSSISACKIQINNYTVSSGDSKVCTAQKEIVVKPGFNALFGSEVQLKISETCSALSSSASGRHKTHNKIEHVSYRDLIESGKIQILEPEIEESSGAKIIAYPNPANFSVVFEYSIETSTPVKITLHDISGSVIGTPVNKYHEAGSYERKYSVSDLPSGMYFYMLQTNKGTEVNRLAIVR